MKPIHSRRARYTCLCCCRSETISAADRPRRFQSPRRSERGFRSSHRQETSWHPDRTSWRSFLHIRRPRPLHPHPLHLRLPRLHLHLRLRRRHPPYHRRAGCRHRPGLPHPWYCGPNPSLDQRHPHWTVTPDKPETTGRRGSVKMRF